MFFGARMTTTLKSSGFLFALLVTANFSFEAKADILCQKRAARRQTRDPIKLIKATAVNKDFKVTKVKPVPSDLKVHKASKV